ncbi:MAG: autotransporter domain-containing protein [Akkermansia sp.]|nr:autotransporter domain-containing protein [Akkermansia sp.]
MKLHLPKGLRSAVLACMAVVTGFATTVGTGVAVGGAMTIVFAASQAQAEVTTYTMAELVSKATTVSEGVVNVTDTHLGVTSYYIPAGHANAICGIADADLSAAIQSDTGYLTVAAWVCPDALAGNQTVFSYGGQNNGFKLSLSGNQLKATTKGAKDGNLSGTTIGSDVLWTLVGVTLNLGDNSGTYLVGDQVTDCGPIRDQDMSRPDAGGADDLFGIGIRNGTTADDEGYQGLIAGLKVFYSTDAAITLSDLLAAMGEAPVMTYSGTDEFTWSGTSTFDGGVAFTTGADVRFTSTSAVVKLGENIQAGGIEIAGGVTMQTGAYKLTASKILVQGNLALDFDAEAMAEVGSFSVAAGATLTTTDATILNKVTLADDTSSLYLTNSEGTKALKFTGAQGGAGLPLNVAAEVDADGYLVVNSAADNDVDYRGSIVVLSGTKLVAASNHDTFGKKYETDNTRTITVQGGAVVDLNGKGSSYHYVLEAGAVISNSSGTIETSWRNMPIVDLLGDAEFHFGNRAGIVRSGYGDSQLNLNGHTLTKVGSGVFHLRNTDVSAGTLNVQEGTLDWLAETSMANTTLQLGGGVLMNYNGGSQELGSLVIDTTVGSGTGATIDVYNNGGPLTVTGATQAYELLTKKGADQLILNGSVVLNAGLTVENGTVVLNSATTIGAAITLSHSTATGTGTLTVGDSGSVSIASLLDFAGTTTEVTVPETNRLVTVGSGTYKVLDKAEGAIVNNFSAVNYGGTAYTLSDDGTVTIDDAKVYFAVENNSEVTVGGDSATAGTADATEFYVKEGATLAFAGTQSGSFTPAKTVSGDGTVRVIFADGTHEKSVVMPTFAGTVEIAGGNSNITTYSLGRGATLKLTAGEHGSDGGASNLNILLSDTKDAYVFRNSNTLILNGKVSGQHLDLGTTNTESGTMVLTNSANDIKHVTLGTETNTSKLTLAADMGFSTINAAKADSVVTLNNSVTLTLGTGTAPDNSAVTTMALAGNGGLNISEQAALTITTQQGGGTLTKKGAGTLTITGNSAAGALVIEGGEFVVNGATMAATTVSGAGTLKLAGDTNTFSNGVTLAGSVDFNDKSITGNLTLADTATVTGVVSASNIAVGTYDNTTGMATAGVITVGTSLSSSADITARKITGAGDVTITGGTVTLSAETNAFANTGDTDISDAELAGTWNADGVTIGAGTTVSGTIGLANSTINSTIENAGSITLSGSITVGVDGEEGEQPLYTHKDNKAADGNGYRSDTMVYALADTGCTASNVTWLDADGNEITSAEFNNGKLTVSEDADKSAYWVNTGIVSYIVSDDGRAVAWNGTRETLDTDAVVKLNGGTLELNANIEAAASIAVETTGTIVVKESYTLNQSAISGTGAKISGTGTYKLGDADALSVGLADNWTGTVYKSEINKGGATEDISSYANADSMIAVDDVCCGSLVVDTGSLLTIKSLTIQPNMNAGARSGATSPLADCLRLKVAGKLAGGGDEGNFNLVISDDLLNTVIGVGKSSGEVVLGTVGSTADNLAITLNNKEKYDLGDSSYTLSWRAADGKQQLVLEAAIKGSEWIGKKDDGTALWISKETSEEWAGKAWADGVEPSANHENANFLGRGDSKVIIYGMVTPGHLRVDTIGSYTITGGPIVGSDVEPELAATGRLNLLNGTLNIEIGKASFDGLVEKDEKDELVTSVVADDAKLNIGNSRQKSDVSIDGGLEIAGEATIANLSQLTVTGGDVTVTGTLAVEGDDLKNNNTPDYSKRGTLVADSLTNAGGEVTVYGGVVQIGSAVATADADPKPLFTNSGTYEVKGGGLTTVLGDAENSGELILTDGTINITGNLVNITGNLDSTGGTLTLTKGDMTVGGELSGVDFATIGANVKLSVGQYEDGTGLEIEGALTVTGESIIGSAITLGETGSLAVDGGSLTTGELKFGELTAESDAKVALSNDGSIGAPAYTTFTTGAADGVLITLDNAADGLVDGNSFRLVDGEDDASGYRLADEYEQTVLLNALKAELLINDKDKYMYLGVRKQTADELVWNTSEDDSEGGLHIMNDSGALYHGYQTLDTILKVNVDADRTIDLSSIAPDPDDADDSLLIKELTGTEKLTITGDGDDRVTINGGEMTGGLDIAGVDLQATDLTVGTLTGTTSTSAATTIGGDITVTKSANYIGGYDGATIAVTDGADATLVTGTGLTVAGDNGSITLNYDSDATIDAIETTGADVKLTGAPDNKLTLAENSTMKGGSLNFDVKSDALGAEIIAGTLGLTGTAVNVAQEDDALVIAGVGSDTTVIASLGDTTGGDVTLTGAGFEKYFANARMVNGNVVADRRSDYVKDSIDATSTNGKAGATLLDDSLVNVNPQVNRDKYATQADLLDAVDAGRMTDEDAAAVAGASVATLGMALSGDVERQLRAIRNRTTSMGVNECVVNEGMPYFNAWVNAEGNRGQLDKDDTLAGYSLDSWGGTVGFDVDFNPHFTAGLAITAMYGNLTADGPETKAEGDMDTYYVTLFARYAEAAWTHTFVGTIGKMDGTFDRTVNAGGVAYETEGSTDGMAFGLMYEVGYVMPLNEDATACMQPIFNVSLRHSNVGSYTEEGSDAALEVGSQSMTVLTFGLGARMQAVVGESLYNRASIFEARALAKVDVGDRSSEADVAFIDGANGATVESAELGAFGVELGAGLTIPVGDDDGSIFIDGSVELRSGYTNVNGTVGYRINF